MTGPLTDLLGPAGTVTAQLVLGVVGPHGKDTGAIAWEGVLQQQTDQYAVRLPIVKALITAGKVPASDLKGQDWYRNGKLRALTVTMVTGFMIGIIAAAAGCGGSPQPFHPKGSASPAQTAASGDSLPPGVVRFPFPADVHFQYPTALPADPRLRVQLSALPFHLG